MLNLAQILDESAQRYPQREALVFNQVRLTYEDLNNCVNQLANGLVKMGIEPGDKIAITCPNLTFFPMMYYAILKVGAVVVPLNPHFKTSEIAYHLRDCEARAYFCFKGTLLSPIVHGAHEAYQKTDSCQFFIVITSDPTEPSPIAGTQTLTEIMLEESEIFDIFPSRPSDTAVILYTSGTTGRPKGAELSHSNLFMNITVSEKSLFNLGNSEVFLISLPLFHSIAQSLMMNLGFLIGATLILMKHFTPAKTLDLMEKEKVTFFIGVPTMYWSLIHYPEREKFDLLKIKQNLRTVVSGGSSLPLEISQTFQKQYGINILEGYGLSETSPVVSFNHFNREVKAGSVGQPIWGVNVKLVDENGESVPVGQPGEILVKGHNVMNGYYNRFEETEKVLENGWFRTGDIGCLDRDGYLFITDRIKDVIHRAGFTIYPREVEEILLKHPLVSLAAVIGIPHEKMGEEVKAIVVLEEGAQLSPAALVAWGKSNMASDKYPRYVSIRNSLPMTATGKILKRELKKEIGID